MLSKVLSLFIFLIGDILLLSASFFFAFILRKELLPGFFHLSYTFPFSIFSTRYYFLLLFIFIFIYEGLYTRLYSPEEELRRVWRGLSIFFLAVLGFAFITRLGGFSRFIIIAAYLLSLILIPGERWVLKSFLYRAGLWRRTFLLTGSEELIEKVRRELLHFKGTGVVLLNRNLQDERKSFETTNAAVIIAKPEIKPEDLLPYSPPKVKEVFLFTGEPFFSTYEVEIERIGTLLFIRLKYNLLRPVNLFLKRALEIFVAGILFLLFLPFFFLIALLVKLTSRGPVFFKQERVGFGGKRFYLCKFRTMTPAKEKSDGKERWDEMVSRNFIKASGKEVREIRGDAKRITKVGRFLRRTSLDELPQFLNLFNGDMSLIGPRPYLPEELAHAGRYFDIITSVKPGITGLWQISGRADLSFEERFLLDEYYVKNWSLSLDIYIFLKTFWVILRGKGAY